MLISIAILVLFVKISLIIYNIACGYIFDLKAVAMKFLNLSHSFKKEIVIAKTFINLTYFLNKKYHIGKLHKTLIVHNSF